MFSEPSGDETKVEVTVYETLRCQEGFLYIKREFWWILCNLTNEYPGGKFYVVYHIIFINHNYYS